MSDKAASYKSSNSCLCIEKNGEKTHLCNKRLFTTNSNSELNICKYCKYSEAVIRKLKKLFMELDLIENTCPEDSKDKNFMDDKTVPLITYPITRIDLSIRSKYKGQDEQYPPWKLPRFPSQELIGGKLCNTCECRKRNGLQDYCVRTMCKGSLQCLRKPDPLCIPSGMWKKYVKPHEAKKILEWLDAMDQYASPEKKELCERSEERLSVGQMSQGQISFDQLKLPTGTSDHEIEYCTCQPSYCDNQNNEDTVIVNRYYVTDASKDKNNLIFEKKIHNNTDGEWVNSGKVINEKLIKRSSSIKVENKVPGLNQRMEKNSSISSESGSINKSIKLKDKAMKFKITKGQNINKPIK